MEIITRIEARNKWQKWYFTWIPCRKWHLEVRWVANTCCRQCNREQANKKRAENPDKDRERCRDWYARNKERALANQTAQRIRNPEMLKNQQKRYYENPKSKARLMYISSKANAKKKNVEFDLDIEWIYDILSIWECQITWIKFDLKFHNDWRQHPYSPSLDRIVPSKWYTKENVRMILWWLNMAFGDFWEEVYSDIAKIYLEKKCTNLT